MVLLLSVSLLLSLPDDDSDDEGKEDTVRCCLIVTVFSVLVPEARGDDTSIPDIVEKCGTKDSKYSLSNGDKGIPPSAAEGKEDGLKEEDEGRRGNKSSVEVSDGLLTKEFIIESVVSSILKMNW